MSRSKVGRRPSRRPDPYSLQVLAEARARALADLDAEGGRQRRRIARLKAEPPEDEE